MEYKAVLGGGARESVSVKHAREREIDRQRRALLGIR